MFWLALSIALIVAVAIGATLLRHPGVLLYDWIATRQAAPRARPATPAPQAHDSPGNAAPASTRTGEKKAIRGGMA
ncbi:hypothetical protein G6F50_016859 [Rhizopus delemar]|uniref:Uncharacterized protein n=1 Tax=Rhizopus delemar TaxID=936053 RepID=A0A9P6XS15_9FUNG|nr:hypothetical protein G6F50_016859 [Rhizopus delemar]